MPDPGLPPNDIADVYDALYTLFDALPSRTHPEWKRAVESVVFGGEGLAADVAPYGAQQNEQNDFKMPAYRRQYGNGDRVTTFPTLTTQSPSPSDQQFVNGDLQLPVAPDTDTVLPLLVDDDTLSDALQLLNQFPTKPGAETPDAESQLLDPNRFPSLSGSSANESAATDQQDTDASTAEDTPIPPNELADLYDGLSTVLESIPSDTHPHWQAALESVLFGGPYLHTDAIEYGAQQAERNDFRMSEYRLVYGGGDRVQTFPVINTQRPADTDTQYVAAGVKVPTGPQSGTVLPIAPAPADLPVAAQLLAEFPAAPDADTGTRDDASLFDADAFLADTGFDDQTNTTRDSADTDEDSESGSEAEQEPGHNQEHDQATSQTAAQDSPPETETTESTAPATTNAATDADDVDDSAADKTVLRQESAGETTSMPSGHPGEGSRDTPQKYDDPQAERAHRRAQQRDPSDVVALGDEITLTLKEVDYTSRPPTIMGTKNRLAVFIIDAPQDLSEYQTITATVVDYGGKNNSAEAAFSGYVD